jgi:hypothetical protein
MARHCRHRCLHWIRRGEAAWRYLVEGKEDHVRLSWHTFADRLFFLLSCRISSLIKTDRVKMHLASSIYFHLATSSTTCMRMLQHRGRCHQRSPNPATNYQSARLSCFTCVQPKPQKRRQISDLLFCASCRVNRFSQCSSQCVDASQPSAISSPSSAGLPK